MSAAWELQDVVVTFSGGLSQDDHTAVAGVSLRIEAGERVGIIGESGSGKTTTARAGLGLVRPASGTVSLFGEDTRSWRTRRWRKARSDAQLLFQDPRSMLNPAMRIGRLLRESATLHQPEGDATTLAEQALDLVELSGRSGAFPHELSGGERRRVGLARLLLARPRLVVADEPTAGLDAARKANLVELLIQRVGPECAVVLISHDLPMVAWSCHRILVMKHGLIVDRFPTTALSSTERHPYTRELLAAAGLTESP